MREPYPGAGRFMRSRRGYRRPMAILRPLLAAAHSTDLRLFRRAARARTPVLDPLLPRLSRAANHGLLWTAIAALLWRLRGRAGRRAAMRGLGSLGAASAVVNLSKLLWRRARPPIADVPVVRRLARLPVSTSFPSGHAASAFAFATGAAQEDGPLAAPLLGLAGAVAYSRVYTGVHYPSDVLVGAAAGTAVALATRRSWPVRPDQPARARPAVLERRERPGPDGSGLAIVVNPDAGSGDESPAGAIRDALPGALVIEASDDLPVREALEKAAAHGCAIGICGGDGSVNAATSVALTHDVPLLVLPGGTLNHFARDLGIETLNDAARAIEHGETVGVDVGEIAGHPFVNTASFGSYVDLVDARERLEDRIGKWPAVVVALARLVRTAEPVTVELDGTPRRVWMAFIGNCRYHPSGFAPSWRDRLDDGRLDLRYVTADGRLARWRLLFAVLTGTLDRCGVYRHELRGDSMDVRCPDGPIRLARDGETFDGPERFAVGKAGRKLAVFVPTDA